MNCDAFISSWKYAICMKAYILSDFRCTREDCPHIYLQVVTYTPGNLPSQLSSARFFHGMSASVRVDCSIASRYHIVGISIYVLCANLVGFVFCRCTWNSSAVVTVTIWSKDKEISSTSLLQFRLQIPCTASSFSDPRVCYSLMQLCVSIWLWACSGYKLYESRICLVNHAQK